MTTKIQGDAQALKLVKDALDKVDSKSKNDARKVLAQAATADGNRYLSQAEAQAALDAFDKASTAGKLLGKDEVNQLAATVAQQVKAQLGQLNLDGLSAYFTSDKTDLEGKVLGALDDTLAAAHGRPVDVDVMIYQFQSKPIADKLKALCQAHPELHVRLVADFSQTSQSGSNQLPALAAAKLPNLEVRYKKDDPYVYDAKLGRAAYSHNVTYGLNHHKGLVATIDGKPYKAVLGSFNWSKTANTSNYEDLIEVDASKNEAAGSMAQSYLDEFRGFFNHPDSLTADQARVYKSKLFDQLEQTKGKGSVDTSTPTLGARPEYQLAPAQGGFDLNSAATRDIQGVTALVGPAVTAKLQAALAQAGRFGSLDELYARVPEAAALPAATRAKLSDLALGDGRASVNVADADELMRAGFSAHQAQLVIEERVRGGAFQSLDELADRVAGVDKKTTTKLADRLSTYSFDAFYSSRGFSDPQGATGYDPAHAASQLAVQGTDGKVKLDAASLSNAIVDLFRRAKPGETVRVSMYGISPGSVEFQELLAASARGVAVKVLLNEGYNDPAVDALKALIAQGRPGLEARVQTAKTMHTKFGVVGDDVFTGSANFSTSASTKNSEDRFVLRNQPELAAEYTREFETVWGKSHPV